MNLYTPVEVVSSMPLLSQENNLLLMGSCFASEMGQRLADAKFRCDVNPYGVLYNPFSISAALREIIAGRCYNENDIFLFHELWHSAMHHGSFSSVSAEETLAGINGRLKSAHERLDRLDCLLLTFGSAWVYENKKTGTVVANCHKQPESCFTRRMLSVCEIVSDYTSLLSGLLARIPRLKVLFTVSPIRHVRDGMHANQLSKATLLLAVNQLQATSRNMFSIFRLMSCCSTSFVTIASMQKTWCILPKQPFAMSGNGLPGRASLPMRYGLWKKVKISVRCCHISHFIPLQKSISVF